MLAEARERWPELRNVSTGRVMRFALAFALTDGNAEAARMALRDARIGTKRNPQTE
jgi:hypothetical protein